MKIVRNVFLLVLLLYMSFDTISPSNVLSFVHEHPASFMQTNQKKQTKTYGLVGLDEPFRQGRSLSLPPLPYQKANRYAVVGVMPAFVLLRLRISHTNRSAIDGITPLICAWIVMNCLLSRTLYIIRCIAISNEMVFVDRLSNIQTYKPTLG